ncbi:t-complex protein 1 subunit zeta [Trichonephila clavata]|nr:t-complex protein 1 subunit zeta [Trichonephila clavata]
MVKLIQEYNSADGQLIGLDIDTGEPLISEIAGILDNYKVKKQLLCSCSAIAGNLLLVDEIVRAGLASMKGQG